MGFKGLRKVWRSQPIVLYHSIWCHISKIDGKLQNSTTVLYFLEWALRYLLKILAGSRGAYLKDGASSRWMLIKKLLACTNSIVVNAYSRKYHMLLNSKYSHHHHHHHHYHCHHHFYWTSSQRQNINFSKIILILWTWQNDRKELYGWR